MLRFLFLSLLFVLIITACQPAPNSHISNDFALEQNPNQATLFAPDHISTGLYERDIAISQTGDEIIFTLGNYKQTHRSLVQLQKTGTSWGKKEVLSISGQYNDIEPFLSVDGKQLFFASNRPMDADSTRKDYNIWVANLTDGQWTKPTPLDTLINTEKDEFYPSVSANGNLYFTATRSDGIGREDIFVSNLQSGTYSTPIPLDTMINTLAFEFNAYINPEENLLIFGSFGRKDGMGGGDLYYSKKDKNGNWQQAKNMGNQVNSTALDYCPFVDVQRGNFYFTSEKIDDNEQPILTVDEFTKHANQILNGMGNIYRIDMNSLNLN